MNLELLFSNFPQLESPRILLREIKDSDLSAIVAIFSDPKVTAFYGISPLASEIDGQKAVRSCIDRFYDRKGIRWGLELKDTFQLVGTIGFQNINEQHQRAEIGFDLNSRYWRQGLMSEALGRVIHFGFDSVGLNRIEAFCEPRNAASVELLKKSGFQLEGQLRRYMRWPDGFHDLNVLSLLKPNQMDAE